jgi:hypothetical protein
MLTSCTHSGPELGRTGRDAGVDEAIGAKIIYFGIRPGSPPGVPGGGITGVMPPPNGGTVRPGSMPAGGQITPFDRDSCSLRLALPVVSPADGKPPVWR